MNVRPLTNSEERRGATPWRLSVVLGFSLPICDLAWVPPLVKVLEQQTWAACIEAVQSGRHKSCSLFRTLLLPEWHMCGAAVGERDVSFASWETMGKALWPSCDFGREKGFWDVVPVGKERPFVKDTV